jgi:hypothetical protein
VVMVNRHEDGEAGIEWADRLIIVAVVQQKVNMPRCGPGSFATRTARAGNSAGWQVT